VTSPSQRLLVIDESLDRRLAHQLEQRGRKAASAERLELLGLLDPEVLRTLSKRDDDWMLVTGDDDMPGEHGPLIAGLGVTIATVDGRRLHDWGREEWKKEIVHRWAHSMQAQPPGTVRRYGLVRHGVWRRRRGRK
jgi:hypothetical protein